MQKKFCFTRYIIVLWAVLTITAIAASAAAAAPAAGPRVLSLAPVATEILFYLGLGGDIVGVTTYCDRPAEAKLIPAVSDIMNVSTETVLALSPDVVAVSAMNEKVGTRLASLGLNVVTASQDDLDAVCRSIVDIGTACGAADHAQKMAALLKTRSDAERSEARTGKRALVVAARESYGGAPTKVYAAGRGSFYSDLLDGAGCENAFSSAAQFSALTLEGLASVEPDIVIELLPDGLENEADSVRASWREVYGEGVRCAVICGNFVLRPGPSYPLMQRAFVIAASGREEIITEDSAR